MRGMRHNVDDRCNGRFQSQGQKRPDGCGYGHDNDGDKGKDEDDNDVDGLGKFPPWWEYVSNGRGGILSRHIPTIDNYNDDCSTCYA